MSFSRQMATGSILMLMIILVVAGCQPAYSQVTPAPASGTPPPRITTTPEFENLPSPTATVYLSPTPTPTPTATPLPTPTPTPLVWEVIGAGVSQTQLAAPVPDQDAVTYVTVLRIDPDAASFRLVYDAANPRTIPEWHTHTGADIVVNGGFFTETNEPSGRLVINGETFGEPFDTRRRIGVAGLLTLDDGALSLYTLARSGGSARPISAQLALESYPMLLTIGGRPIYGYNNTERRSRRTAIGIDREGNLLIIVVNDPILSLYEFAQWLTAPGLNLEKALNLDGGRSTGMQVDLPGASWSIPSYVPLPIVLAVDIHG